MSLREINKMIRRLDQLTEGEKKTLADAILANPKARSRVVSGFIAQGDYSRAFQVIVRYCT